MERTAREGQRQAGHRAKTEVIMIAKRFLSGVLVLALVSVAAPALAQASRSNPYSKLFKPRDLKEVARAAPAAPRIDCDATKVPVNPQTDPKVARDRSITHYAMRVLPPGCNP
jgi:hypothetical protein